jgi:crotonobetainyl-CoA:carnitine CoA-transferase CaiB-like acyl-CoA transferase
MDGRRFGARLDPPAPGRDTRALLEELGYSAESIASLVAARCVVLGGEGQEGRED